MRATARVYWRLLAAGFRRQSAYRLAALGGLVANLTFGLLRVAVLFATVRAAGGELHGYDTASMSTYVWLSQGMLGSVNLTGRTDLALRVKDGQVAVDFLRPVDLQAATVATEAGRALFALIPRGLPSVLLGAVTVGISLPASIATYPLGAVSLVLGIVISAATAYLIAVAGFWLVETRGLQILYMLASGFLGGLYVPVALFPPVAAGRRRGHAVPFGHDVPDRRPVRDRRRGERRPPGARAGGVAGRGRGRRAAADPRGPAAAGGPGWLAGWAGGCGLTVPSSPRVPARSAPTGRASPLTWAAPR